MMGGRRGDWWRHRKFWALIGMFSYLGTYRYRYTKSFVTEKMLRNRKEKCRDQWWNGRTKVSGHLGNARYLYGHWLWDSLYPPYSLFHSLPYSHYLVSLSFCVFFYTRYFLYYSCTCFKFFPKHVQVIHVQLGLVYFAPFLFNATTIKLFRLKRKVERKRMHGLQVCHLLWVILLWHEALHCRRLVEFYTFLI